MILALLLCCGLTGADGAAPSATSSQAEHATYKAAKAKAGKNADAHVRLAIWCEAHGLSAERVRHLALAVMYDPANALARGLLGMVSFDGKWRHAEDVSQAIREDPKRQAIENEYLDRRVKTPNKADAQQRLAAWCDQNGLKEQALAHYSEVIRLDPSRDAAWRRLGYKKQGNQWVKPEEAAAQKKEAERQKRADKVWKPKLERLRDSLTAKDPARRTKAEDEVAGITDPRAVPMIWATLLKGNERVQLAAVQILAQIDGPSASNSLAVLAIFNPSPAVRQRAAESLSRRDPRDVVGRLIGLIKKPFKYRYTPPHGPGTTGELLVEGEKFNIDRFYNHTPIDPSRFPRRIFSPDVPFDPYNAQNMALATLTAAPQSFTVAGAGAAGTATQLHSSLAGYGMDPNTNPFFWFTVLAARQDQVVARAIERVQQDEANLEQAMARDIQTIEMTNAGIKLVNSRALPLLKVLSGKDLGTESEQWKGWWTDQLGYVYRSPTQETKPTFTDFVSIDSTPAVHSACFAAGTLVKTLGGPRAIETVQVGDRVLAQNTTTGDLSFQPVVVIHKSEPSATLKVAIGDDTIVATGIHRFWKPGKGWTMARDLKPGDPVRMVGGVVKVRSVEKGATQPVYNLDVAENRNFFVGNAGVLVHDFSFVQPVSEPFDRAADLVGADAEAGANEAAP